MYLYLAPFINSECSREKELTKPKQIIENIPSSLDTDNAIAPIFLPPAL